MIMLKKLSYESLREAGNQDYILETAPERILQFGEGNFLRGFVDYFIDLLNERLDFNSKVVVVQPIARGLAPEINRQNGLYQLYLRGIENGQKINRLRLISCIGRAINPYEEFHDFLQTAHNPEMRFIVSNTTEAGIVFDPGSRFDDAPPENFPAKLTRLLFERFTAFEKAKGYVILSCELIDNNGAELKKNVLRYANQWKLGDGFSDWIQKENIFCSTLVDRIVTGYPKEEAAQLNLENGYEDALLDTAEAFGLWVIEGPDFLKKELPFAEAGLPVIFTADHTPYKKRKVRILNGAHTSAVLAAYLYGETIVRGCMEDSVISRLIHRTVFEEIIPTLSLPADELKEFASAVMERFRNPYIDHRLLDISLNSVSKWNARVKPTMTDFYNKYLSLPPFITFSFSALMAFYCGTEFRDGYLIGHRSDEEYPIRDSAEVLKFFAENCNKLSSRRLVEKFAGPEGFFDEDLTAYPGFTDKTADWLDAIRSRGMKRVLDEIVTNQ